MPVTDTISDLLTRIRNASAAKHKTVDVPYSRLKMSIAEILKDQGFVADVARIIEGPQGLIRITLRYYQRQPAIRVSKRVSKPGRRIYAPADQLPRVKNGLGISIISTSKGVMTDKDARKFNVGGEVLCTIW